MKSVYLIEDMPLVLELLNGFLSSTFPELEIIGSQANGMEALKECLQKKPDLVIADIQVPEVNGLEILHMLKTKIPGTKILLFTGNATSDNLDIAVHEQADGFVAKGDSLKELETAITRLREGLTYFSPAAFPKGIMR